jgi:ElaB/YqjD/DUF883 family membrane-anchored ribosome-binding protein
MPDLTPAEQATLDASGVTPGPGSPLADAVDRSPMPIPPALDDDGVDLSMLSAEDLRARILARERDMKFRIDALKHEVVTVGEDLNVGGRPVMDIVRQDPVRAVAVAVGSGLLVGLVLGVVSRRRHRPEPDHGLEAVQVRLAHLIDDAARRVARGTSAEDALRATTRDLPVYTPSASAGKTAQAQASSSVRQAVDMAVKSAVGFALKAATDQLTRKLTGKSDTVAAVAEAPDRS